ncbi:M23 family metallopeptidase [Candidatus Dojkabacteria bacterium]|nr:M23 family metallopeptidase [Candidatus Dojkabacteria bacterium]
MPVTITATPTIPKAITSDQQWIVNIIKLYKSNPNIVPLVNAARAKGINIDTVEPTEIRSWRDIREMFGDLSAVMNSINTLHSTIPLPGYTIIKSTGLTNEAQQAEEVAKLAERVDPQHVRILRFHRNVPIHIGSQDNARFVGIDLQRQLAQDRNRRGILVGQAFYDELNRISTLEKQIEDRLYSEEMREQQYIANLSRRRAVEESKRQAEDQIIQRSRTGPQHGLRVYKKEQAEDRQVRSDLQQITEDNINLYESGRPTPRPILVYHPVRRSSKEVQRLRQSGARGTGATAPSLTSDHVFQRGMAGLEFSPLVDPNTGRINYDAIEAYHISKRGAKNLREAQIVKRFTRAQSNHVNSATATIETELQRQDVHEGIADVIGSTLGGGTVHRQIGEEVAKATADQLVEIFRTGLQTDGGHRGAMVLVREYIRTAGRPTGELNQTVTEAVIRAIKRIDPTITDALAESRARHILPQCLRGLQSAPNIPVHDIELSVRRIGGRKELILTDTAGVLSTDGSEVQHEWNTWSASPSPVSTARWWTGAVQGVLGINAAQRLTQAAEDVSQLKWEQLQKLEDLRVKLNSYLAEDGIHVPEEVQELAPDGRISRLQLANEHMEMIIDQERAFRQNPFVALSWPLYIATPRSLRPLLWQKLPEFLTAEDLKKKYYIPYYQTDEYIKFGTQIQVNQFLAQLSPFVYVNRLGRFAPAPLEWLNHGWNASVDGFGRLMLSDYSKRESTMGLSNAEQSFRMNWYKFAAQRVYDNKKNRDPISLILGVTVIAAFNALINFVASKVGLLPYVNTIRTNIQGLGDSFRYGSGWADPQYLSDLKLVHQRAHIILPDRFYRILGGVGKVAAGASTVFELSKIAVKSGLKGAALGLLVLAVTGNPVLAYTIGGTYFGFNAARSFMHNPRFAGQWVNGQYVEGGLGLPTSNWYKIFGARGEAFAKAWTAPVDSLIKLQGVSRLTKWAAWGLRNFPLDGLLFSVALWQLGAPAYIALLPLGAEVTIRAIQGISKLRWMQFVRNFYSFGMRGVTLFAQLGFTSYMLSESGGLLGLFRSLTMEGFTFENILKLIQIPGTFAAFAGFFSGLATLLGIANFPVAIAAAVATVAFFVTDELLRAFTGKGLWEYVFQPAVNWIWDQVKGLFQKGIETATGALSFMLGLLTFIKALMSGNIHDIAMSLIMMVIGGMLISSAGIMIFHPAAYYTAIEGGAAQNAFITSINKSFVSLYEPDHNQLTYKYEYNLNAFAANEISSITIDERDTFEGISQIQSVYPSSFQKSGTTIELTETHNRADTVRREFTITLSDALENLLPDPDDKLCNTLTLVIDSVVKTDGTTITPQEPNVTYKLCIDSNGQVVGATLNILPLTPGTGNARISSCYGNRPVGGGTEFHSGIDIAANEGTTVYAAGEGVVEAAKYDSSGGNFVRIHHGDGIRTYYGHLRVITVSVGEQVGVNGVRTKIGEVGHTGQVRFTPPAKGDHLHFGVYYQSDSYNPCLENALNICTAYPMSPEAQTYPNSCGTTPRGSPPPGY